MQLLYHFCVPPDGPSPEPQLDILPPDGFDSLRSGLAADIRSADAEALAGEELPFWLVQLVGDADGPEAALAILRLPEVLRAVLEKSGTSLRPITGGGISLHLKPLVDTAGEPALELLRELAEGGTLPEELADELRVVLEHPPDDP